MTGLKVGFLNNQIDNRGTGNALFDYAHYNELILGNESLIFSFEQSPPDDLMVERINQRFGKYYSVYDLFYDGYKNFGLDVLYHINYGTDFALTIPNARYVVHAVFDASHAGKRGVFRYATISEWMGKRYNVPFVPHIVDLPATGISLRSQMGIPEDSVVFGRHGGADSFDVSFAWEAVEEVASSDPNKYFLFMNTNMPTMYLPDNCIFVDPTSDPYSKRAFIETCDYMLHARERGETFGISVGEFGICGRRIITYANSGERAHLEELGDVAITYVTRNNLVLLLRTLERPTEPHYAYTNFTPIKVMKKFQEVFLSE